MKTNELRIGNLIKFSENGTIFTVGSIEERGFTVQNDEETTWIEAEEFEPIPLSEEWLLKFGFEKDSSLFCFDSLCVSIENNKIWVKGYTLTHNKFYYVHQLQNLYFALTGEELTYGGHK